MNATTVGFLISKLDGVYQSQLMQGVKAGARETGLHVLCFPGNELDSHSAFLRAFNLLYRMAAVHPMAGLISATGSFTSHITQDVLDELFASFGSTPVVSLGHGSGGVAVVQSDNRAGMAELVDHFLLHHRFRRIGFVTGPVGNGDAVERLAVFRERHAAAGIPVDERLIFPGQFDRDAGRRAVDAMVAQGLSLDALIAANDEMAVSAVSSLLAHGFNVPGDVAVAGYDDLASAIAQTLPLSSVNQQVAEHTRTAVHQLAGLSRGEPLPMETVLPTRAVLRHSCGCTGLSCPSHVTGLWESPAAAAAALDGLRSALVLEVGGTADALRSATERLTRDASAGRVSFPDLRNALLSLQREIPELAGAEDARRFQAASTLLAAQALLNAGERLFLGESVLQQVSPNRLPSDELLTGMPTGALSLTHVLTFIRDTLIAVGTKNAYLVLYPKPATLHRWADAQLPEDGQLVMGIRDGQVMHTGDFDRFPLRDLLPFPVFHQSGGAVYSLLPLFQQQEHFGYMVLDLDVRYGMGFEQLREVISNLVVSALFVAELQQARQRLRQDLDRIEESNQLLSQLAQHDELTGLYNRRGFFAQAALLCAAAERPMLLISADMDGLKQINDTYGHAAGDRAIQSLATVLRQAFRTGDLIARLGGDEFVILSRSFAGPAEPLVRRRLRERLDAHNAQSGDPWTLDASVGFAVVTAGDGQTIEGRLAEADLQLYEEKRRRKRGTARGGS